MEGSALVIEGAYLMSVRYSEMIEVNLLMPTEMQTNQFKTTGEIKQ